MRAAPQWKLRKLGCLGVLLSATSVLMKVCPSAVKVTAGRTLCRRNG